MTDQKKACFESVKNRYADHGVDVENALEQLASIPISMHCWQGDDVVGFEGGSGISDGGIMATGNYPGRARNADELRSDMEKVFSLVPGEHRIALHAIYAETGRKAVSREKLEPAHFSGWIDWARAQRIKLDYNPTFFSHPKAADGFTLASRDKGIRDFWIEHGISSRVIGESMGKKLDTTCITNFWVPDGYKDTPANRFKPRELLKESLDRIFSVKINERYNRDSVESKLFGIGSESYVVGSHEFYTAYAIKNNKVLCLDSGHFHPTETIADKISSLMLFLDELLLHVSRGIRWDSDHVVVLNDEVKSIMLEIVRGGFLDRVHIGLDYFDASINRVAAWTIGMRSVLKALLLALLEPHSRLVEYEANGDFTGRLALLETTRTFPFGVVWDHYCEQAGVPDESNWYKEITAYEKSTLSNRE